MLNLLHKGGLCLLFIGLAGCNSGNAPNQPVRPEILNISWGSGAVLPGQSRTLVAETSGAVASFEWEIHDGGAVLSSHSSPEPQVDFLRSGSVEGEPIINGPNGEDTAEFTIDVAMPQVASFSEVTLVPLPSQAKGAYEPTAIIADNRIWILHSVELPADSLPQFKIFISSALIVSVESPSAWSSVIFSENLCTPKRIFATDELLGIVYAAQIVDDPEDTSQVILGLAPLGPVSTQAEFAKTNLVELELGLPGDRFQVRESALLVLRSRSVSPPFNKPVLGRISLTPTVTSADYVEGDLPGSTGPFWDPQMLLLDDGIAIAWGYDRNQYMFVQSVFPPWDTYDRGDLPMSPTATQVTGLGPWSDSGIVMGFWDQGTGRQFVTTSPTVTPTLSDWTTPVEVQQTLLGNPVMWGGRQVWHTSSNPAFPGQVSLARTIAAPPTSLDDLVFAPMAIDNIGRSEIPNMVEIEGRLVIAHPQDPDGTGPEPARIRLLRSDGPW